MDAGAHYIEFDIQCTKDKELVVIHDFTLDRTTNVSGNVKDFSLKELLNISAGYSKKFGEQFNQERIPTLNQVVSLCMNQAIMLIEIKREDHALSYDDGLEDKALKIIANNNAQDKIIFVSFNLASVALIKKMMPSIITGTLFYKIDEEAISKSLDIGASYIIFSYKTKPSSKIISKVKEKNLMLGLYTIDNRKDFKKYASVADAIATNYFKEMNDYFCFF